mmetsp:Transcript_14085/g.37822  ORF Transcript_14085/g.37822 Transcript_14085/m.37822 type:complete len:252 (-) Transcript_14085:408-1163(-)
MFLHVCLQRSVHVLHRFYPRQMLLAVVSFLVRHEHLAQVKLSSTFHVADVRHGLRVEHDPSQHSDRLSDRCHVVVQRLSRRHVAGNFADLAHFSGNVTDHTLHIRRLWHFRGLAQKFSLFLPSFDKHKCLLLHLATNRLACREVCVNGPANQAVECAHRVFASAVLVAFIVIVVAVVVLCAGRATSEPLVPLELLRVVRLDIRLEIRKDLLHGLDPRLMFRGVVGLLVSHEHLARVKFAGTFKVADVRDGL